MVLNLDSQPEPCPFCHSRLSTQHELVLHIERDHAEAPPPRYYTPRIRTPPEYYTPKASTNDSYADDEDDDDDDENHIDHQPTYVDCPEDACGELVLTSDLQTHMDFHVASKLDAEGGGAEEAPPSRRRRRRGEEAPPGEEQERENRHRHHRHRSEHGERGGERRERDPKEELERRERRREREREEAATGVKTHRHRERSRREQPPPPPVHKLNWFERAAMALVHAPSGGSRDRGVSLRRSHSKHVEMRPERSQVRSERSQVRPERMVVPPPVEEPAKLRRHRSSSKPPRGPEREKKKREKKKKKKKVGEIKKLGKSDLGPYAHEDVMPDWLRAQLVKGGKAVTITKIDHITGRLVNVVQIANETPDLIPTIALLCERDPDIARAFLCHAGTKHVGKQIPKEGGFCGYRNIQMLISYIQAAYPQGTHPFEGRIPNILRMQDMIEDGWEKGINTSARAETGGIRGTRKYIGTSEAQTLFTSVGLRSRARAFVKSEGSATPNALLDFVEEYFSSDPGAMIDPGYKIVSTTKPPIYLQHSGHSMTIIGLERWKDGSASLLVFDPFFSPSDAVKNLAGMRRLSSRVKPDALLKVYRRKMGYLLKYREFEVILLVPPGEAGEPRL